MQGFFYIIELNFISYKEMPMQSYNELREFIREKKHHEYRKHIPETLAAEYSRLGLSPKERMTRRFEYLSSLETPGILDGEKIVFLRTAENIPDCFTEE